MVTFDEIRAKARRTEMSVRLCLAGELFAQHAELDAELASLSKRNEPETLSGSRRAELVDAIREIEQQMEAETVVFRFRALGPAEFAAMRSKHLNEESGTFAEALWPELVADCSVDPKMTVDEVQELFNQLSEGQRDALGSAAWDANHAGKSVPFSRLASVKTPDSDRN